MTPSRIGLMAVMLPGVRPSISLASMPTASICALVVLKATIDGSLSTMPRPRANTHVLAVPRSIARSFEKIANAPRNTEPPNPAREKGDEDGRKVPGFDVFIGRSMCDSTSAAPEVQAQTVFRVASGSSSAMVLEPAVHGSAQLVMAFHLPPSPGGGPFMKDKDKTSLD